MSRQRNTTLVLWRYSGLPWKLTIYLRVTNFFDFFFPFLIFINSVCVWTNLFFGMGTLFIQSLYFVTMQNNHLMTFDCVSVPNSSLISRFVFLQAPDITGAPVRKHDQGFWPHRYFNCGWRWKRGHFCVPDCRRKLSCKGRAWVWGSAFRGKV